MAEEILNKNSYPRRLLEELRELISKIESMDPESRRELTMALLR